MKLIEQPLLMLRAAERARERKREWRWQAVCAVGVAAGLVWFGGNAIGVW